MKDAAGGVAPTPPSFRMLQQQLEILHYLLLELINGLCHDSHSNAFIFMTNLNVELENEAESFKSIVGGFCSIKCFQSSIFFFDY